MPDIIFYIDKSKNPRSNPILSLANPSTDDSKLVYVSSDKLDFAVVFVNGTDIDTSMANPADSKSLDLSFGTVGLNTPVTSTTNWYLSSSYGYTGSVDFTPFTSSIGTDAYINPSMQLLVTSGTGTRQTYMLRQVTVLNSVNTI